MVRAMSRRLSAALALGFLASSMIIALPGPAQAATITPPAPVAPIPSLPSQTNAALTGSKLADNTTIKTVQIW
ncbi:MAG: hypothetical protein K0S37_3669, partial [Microbacterium sp.]|nr:hypothetical protein [Microbacterium sp.]